MFSFLRSIHSKIIFWALLPCFVVMGGITFLSLVTIKNTALEVVTKRDVVLAEFAAKRLSENIQKYPVYLDELAGHSELKNLDVTRMDNVFEDNTTWLHVFDDGITLYQETGLALWSSAPESVLPWSYFPDPDGFIKIQNTLRPYFSNILYPYGQEHGIIIVAVPILDEDNSFVGVLAGTCTVNYSTIGATYTQVLEYESGKSSYAFLVDGNGHVLYHRHSSLIGSEVDDMEPVQRVILREVGAMVSENLNGEMIISGYAPVPGTGWGVVTQGNWSIIQDLIHFYTRFFQIILWGSGLIITILVLYFMQRLLGPVKALTEGAEQIASGNFIEIPVKRTGDEIEVLSRQFNSMARAMEASFAANEVRIRALDRARQDLTRSEERIRGIINAVNDIMFMVDDSGEILWLNDKGKVVFGENVEGLSYCEVLHQQVEIPEDCFIRGYFNDEEDNDIELKIWSEGRYQDYWCTANVVHRNRMGRVDRVVVVCRNMSEKKQLRAEVQRNAQLAALGELAAGIAHEINNPVTGIINYAQIIEDSWNKPDQSKHEQLPGWIIKEGERVAIIISKLLSFARRDIEKKKPVMLGDLLNDVLDLTGAMLKKEHLAVEVNLPDDMPPARAVIHQIQQIFLNVIGNARYALNQKYPKKDPFKKIVITGSTFEEGGQLMVRIIFEDYGTGIASGVLEKVCNPFFSTKPPDEGTGLGLSISYGIIEEHHGELRLESVEGEWTRVTIDLPSWR